MSDKIDQIQKLYSRYDQLTDDQGKMILKLEKELRNLVRDLSSDAHIDQPNEAGDSLLILAVKHGHVDVVKSLLNKGADANLTDRDGYSALHWCARKKPEILAAHQKGNNDIIGLLVRKGAVVKDVKGLSVVQQAIKASNVNAVLSLIKLGADPSGYENMPETMRNFSVTPLKALVPLVTNQNKPNGLGDVQFAAIAQHLSSKMGVKRERMLTEIKSSDVANLYLLGNDLQQGLIDFVKTKGGDIESQIDHLGKISSNLVLAADTLIQKDLVFQVIKTANRLQKNEATNAEFDIDQFSNKLIDCLNPKMVEQKINEKVAGVDNHRSIAQGTSLGEPSQDQRFSVSSLVNSVRSIFYSDPATKELNALKELLEMHKEAGYVSQGKSHSDLGEAYMQGSAAPLRGQSVQGGSQKGMPGELLKSEDALSHRAEQVTAPREQPVQNASNEKVSSALLSAVDSVKVPSAFDPSRG